MDLGGGALLNLFIHLLNMATLNKSPSSAFCHYLGFFNCSIVGGCPNPASWGSGCESGFPIKLCTLVCHGCERAMRDASMTVAGAIPAAVP